MQENEARIIATSSRLRLRDTREEDLDYVLAVESDPANTPFIAHWPRERHQQAMTDPGEEHWIVESLDDGARVGYVIMQEVGAEKGVRLRRIAIDRKGAGLGGETVELVKQAAFGPLGARRLWLDVQPHNERAMHVYGKCGFTFNGEIHQHIRGNDVICRVMDIGVD
jgi:RimJ/RimL family protein N-acetyltransferase